MCHQQPNQTAFPHLYTWPRSGSWKTSYFRQIIGSAKPRSVSPLLRCEMSASTGSSYLCKVRKTGICKQFASCSKPHPHLCGMCTQSPPNLRRPLENGIFLKFEAYWVGADCHTRQCAERRPDVFFLFLSLAEPNSGKKQHEGRWRRRRRGRRRQNLQIGEGSGWSALLKKTNFPSSNWGLFVVASRKRSWRNSVVWKLSWSWSWRLFSGGRRVNWNQRRAARKGFDCRGRSAHRTAVSSLRSLAPVAWQRRVWTETKSPSLL